MSGSRREFLKRSAIAAASAAALPASLPAAAPATPPEPLEGAAAPVVFDAALLGALGEAVLPESLGSGARAQAVRDFASWAAGYRPVSEEMHGYGEQEITYTAADPSPGWRAQLEALELLARRKHRKSFTAITVEQRRGLIRPLVPRGRGTRLPANIIGAPHIAIAVMAHWAASSSATDLAYGVSIGKDQCRTLADAPRKPVPLTRAPRP